MKYLTSFLEVDQFSDAPPMAPTKLTEPVLAVLSVPTQGLLENSGPQIGEQGSGLETDKTDKTHPEKRRAEVRQLFHALTERLVIRFGRDVGTRSAPVELVTAFDAAEDEANRAALAYIRGETASLDVFTEALARMEAIGAQAMHTNATTCMECHRSDLTVTVSAIDTDERLCRRCRKGGGK